MRYLKKSKMRWVEPNSVRVCMECVDYDMGGYCRCAQSMMYHVEMDGMDAACKLFISRRVLPIKKKRKKDRKCI